MCAATDPVDITVATIPTARCASGQPISANGGGRDKWYLSISTTIRKAPHLPMHASSTSYWLLRGIPTKVGSMRYQRRVNREIVDSAHPRGNRQPSPAVPWIVNLAEQASPR